MEKENYKPSKKEVFSEIGNKTKYFIKKNWKSLVDNQKLFYAVPTMLRKIRKDNCEIERNIGDGIGTTLLATQAIFYVVNATNQFFPDNELYLIPVATNVASGLYEGVRAIYKNTEKKLIKNHNKGLEEEVKQ